VDLAPDIVLLVGFLYLLGPVLIWLTFKQRVYALSEPIDRSELPPELDEFSLRVAPELEREGFVLLACFRQTGSVAGMSAYMLRWQQPERGQLAHVYAVLAAGRIPTNVVLEFETITADGRDVMTNTIRGNAGIYDALRWRHVASLPWLATRPRSLYQVHLNREQRILDPASPRYLPPANRLPESAAAAEYFLLRELVRTGLFREARVAGEFRPTFPGAWRLVMRMLPPAKQLRVLAAKRRARVDEAESQLSPAPRPVGPVTVTRQSPYDRPLQRFPLTYA